MDGFGPAQAATLVTATLITGLIAGLVTARLIAAGLVAAGLVAAARGLVFAAAVAAPTVAARPFADGGVACLAVVLRHPGRLRSGLGLGLLGLGLLGVRLLGVGPLGSRAPTHRAPGFAVAARPVARGLVEAELLLCCPIRAETAAGAVADAGRGDLPNAGLRIRVWFHGVLLPQASRVSSRGRGTLV